MASIPFSRLPHPVDSSANLTPYTIFVPDAEVDKLKLLLELSPIAPPNRANTCQDCSQGISRKELVALAEYWKNEYDW